MSSYAPAEPTAHQCVQYIKPLLVSLQNQFGYQDPSFDMEDMMGTIPRVLSLSPGDQSAGGQGGSGSEHQCFEDQRCNGTLRKQATPRPAGPPGSDGAPGDTSFSTVILASLMLNIFSLFLSLFVCLFVCVLFAYVERLNSYVMKSPIQINVNIIII